MKFRSVLDDDDAFTFGNRVGEYPQECGLTRAGAAADKQRLPAANLLGQKVRKWARQRPASDQIFDRVTAAGELAYDHRRIGTHDRRNHSRKAASVRELRVQERVVFVEPFAELICDDFEAGAKPAGVEGNRRFAVDDPVAFVPPWGVGIAHDLADVFVQQHRLYRAKERKDQFKTHTVDLRAMEAQQLARLPGVKNNGLCGRFFCGTLVGLPIFLLVFRGGLFSAVELQDRGNPDFPDTLLRVRFLAVVLPAAQLAFHLDMRAFGERLGELRELAEDYATVPFGVRDVLAILLVGGLGCQREGCDAEVRAVGASFWVAAEEADEGYFV